MNDLYIDNFNIILTLITIVVVIAVVLGICAYSTFLERKIAGWVQDRKGPNRVGPFGLLQPIADGLKFLLKEGIIPKNVDRFFYLAAPSIALITALMAFAVVPFGPTTVPPTEVQRAWPQTIGKANESEETFQESKKTFDHTYQFVVAPGLDIGIVYVFAIGSLNVYAIILGGWSSNNKYSMLGSLRASAQVISYEIPMGMSILGAAVLAGSLNLERIIDYQVHNGWLVFYQPLAAILFVTAVFAECNRVPFDLSECEQELVAGYHTEYSGMKFAMFFLGEYTHMITTSFLVMLVFFGGWSFFGLENVLGDGAGGIILKAIIFGGKMIGFIVFYMMVRWTLPRFRFDQLMGLAWKVLLPLLLGNLIAVLVYKQLAMEYSLTPWLLTPISFVLLIGAGYYTLSRPVAVAKKKPLAA